MKDLFFKPSSGTCGDVIPFYHAGVYYLYYLHIPAAADEVERNGISWFLVTTSDFQTFEEHGVALASGGIDADDFLVFTGSIVAVQGKFHVFYTGHNSKRRAEGASEQVILHAVSDDLKNWQKDSTFRMAPPAEYELHDWRDPMVRYDEDLGCYRMLITARLCNTPAPNRHAGVLVEARSTDLRQWDIVGNFWSPHQYYTLECPDWFAFGGNWHLLFSENVNRFATCQRVSASADGPWVKPNDELLDAGRGWYAAKSAGNAEERYAVGWCGSKQYDNEGFWDGSGCMVAHRLECAEDGHLTVTPAPALRRGWKKMTLPAPRIRYGDWSWEHETYSTTSQGRFSLLELGELPPCCRLLVGLSFAQNGSYALWLRADAECDRYHALRLEPDFGRLVTDMRPRPMEERFSQERHLPDLPERKVELELYLDRTMLVVYAAGTAISERLFFPDGKLLLAVTEGTAQFHVRAFELDESISTSAR